MKKNRAQRRQKQTIWLKWTVSKATGTLIELIYWRRVVYTKTAKEEMSWSWWEMEEQAKAWARRKGFKVIKEKLYNV